jgi:quercetin dioxygenase-like cupin family protein
MRKSGLLAICVFVLVAWPDSRPSLEAVEPGEGEPGIFKVLHEDEAVRIVLATTPPGKTEGWHSHPRYFAYVVQGSKMRYDFPDGTTRDVDLAAGLNRLNNPVVKHRGSNIGDSTFQALLVEFKK